MWRDTFASQEDGVEVWSRCVLNVCEDGDWRMAYELALSWRPEILIQRIMELFDVNESFTLTFEAQYKRNVRSSQSCWKNVGSTFIQS